MNLFANRMTYFVLQILLLKYDSFLTVPSYSPRESLSHLLYAIKHPNSFSLIFHESKQEKQETSTEEGDTKRNRNH